MNLEVEKLFEINGWLTSEGFTQEGLKAMAALLERLPKVHQGIYREAFIPLMSRVYTLSAEIVVVRDKKFLMTWREDPFYKGWHVPGGFMGPGESRQETVERIAGKEIKCKPRFVRAVELFLNDHDPRFPHGSVIFHC